MTKLKDSNCVRQKFLFINFFVIFLILLIVGIPGISFSKTLTRGCKGAEMIQYEINGKKYTHIGPFRYNGTGILWRWCTGLS
ncbi:hypothetical protein [Desulfobacula sp.]|uniref:hypothetical protein n=1 Tax=Desulfobacula sp. TaxID=2593537 RepID=UPI0025BBA49E|nr:hypothetical protein [Desulfobacula sp.]MBC2705122.1 hypothetical protein [Desulfobacula sp.]